MQTTKQTTAAGLKAPGGSAARIALALLVALCCQAAAVAQGAPSGPAGGDLAGTYPNPSLASDRVKTGGDSMTGALDITLPSAGAIVTPFKLAATGNPGAGRGLAFQFHVPWGSANGVGLSGLGSQITSAWDSAGKTYFGFSAYNGTAVSEVFRVSGSGNVGVGTANPTSKLHVASGTDSSATLLHLESGTATTRAGAAFSVSSNASSETGFDLSVKRAGAYSSRFGVSGAGHVYLQPLGGAGVGVGTATPGATLDIQYTANDGTAGLKLGKAGTSRGFIFSDGDLRIGIDNNNDVVNGAFSIYHNGNISSELLRVQDDGHVGVGTSTPAYRLDVQGGQVNASGGLCIAGVCKSSWGELGGTSQWTAAASGGGISYGGGNVGVGVASPSHKLHVGGGGIGVQNGAGDALVTVFSGAANERGAFGWSTAGFTYVQGGAWGVVAKNLVLQGGGGNVGVGTTAPAAKLDVVGNVNASGNLNVTGAITGGSIAAEYQDVAEWVPSTQQLVAGTVVVLDTQRSNQVLASTAPYDTKVAGVVSAQPGLVLGKGGEGKVMVATTGRVRVRVDATRAPVRVGDLLVTSGIEGAAMKSLPVDLAGTPIHRPGTIIGKALEPLAGGVSEILVLLSLQ